MSTLPLPYRRGKKGKRPRAADLLRHRVSLVRVGTAWYRARSCLRMSLHYGR